MTVWVVRETLILVSESNHRSVELFDQIELLIISYDLRIDLGFRCLITRTNSTEACPAL
jgi:hypothetical protein